MAKLKGPLFSIDARGKLGNSLVFSSNRGIKRAAKHYKPTNPRTVLQQDNRTILRHAVLSWQSLDDDQKWSYNQSAKNLGLKMSGYNYYLQTYINAYITPPPPPATYILDGLISWWKMDEDTGDYAYDSISNNHGTITDYNWIAGKSNSGLWTDMSGRNGTNEEDRIQIANESNFDFPTNTPFSVLAWIYATWEIGNPPTLSTSGIIIGKGVSLAPLITNWRLFAPSTSDNIMKFECYDAGFKRASYSITPAELFRKWTFVVGTYDSAGVLRVYVDAVKGTDSAPGQTLPVNDMPVCIGATNEGVGTFRYPFPGIVDEVAVYNRTLSQAEIQQNYEAFL